MGKGSKRVAGILSLLIWGRSAPATVVTWDGGGIFDDRWTNFANWVGLRPLDAGPAAEVRFGNRTTFPTSFVDVPHTLLSLEFNDASTFDIRGSTLSIGALGLTSHSSAT